MSNDGQRLQQGNATNSSNINESYREYFRRRWKESNIWKYVSGEHLNYEESDKTVEVFSLLCALFLTIPFSVMGSLSFDLWDWIQATFETCPDKSNENSVDILQDRIQQRLTATVICSIATLTMAIMYFTLRPRDPDPDKKDSKAQESEAGATGKKFEQWYKDGGRYLLLLIVVATLSSMYATYVLFVQALQILVTSTDNLCNTWDSATIYLWGLLSYLFFAFAGLLVSF